MIGTNPISPQRFLAASLLLALAGCGSGGGGGPGVAAPVIVTASFSGAGSTPAAGDTLVLAFSTTITLATGQLLTDDDLVLSTGDTLGTVTVAPSLLSSNTLSVTLGTGVNFTPGTSTVALGAGNDVVGGSTTAPQAGGDPVTIATSDGVAPTVSNVTVAMIDDELNGTGAAGGTLQVPTNGWNIDLTYSDNSAIATSQTVITADAAVSTTSGSQLAGTNLQPFLTEVNANNTAATYTVPTTVQFPQTTITLTVIVSDVGGLTSTPTTFTVAVRPFSDALQPFETSVNASQVWFLDFSRDLESYTTSAVTGGFDVNVVNGANGTSDFEDLLRILGLTTATPIANVQSGMDSNEVAIDRLKTNLLADLAAFYTGANVTFTLTQPAGSFGSNTSVTYSSIGYSAISIGGASTTSGVLGLAIYDPSNTTQNDNTVTDFDSQRLGVFVHTIVDSGMGPPSSSNFRTTFDVFSPDQGGTPIGDDSQDGDRLLGTVGDSRETAINTALADLAQFIATVTAHECGHSVGLVVNGAMPNGLYGNDSVNFPGSANGHIRNASLFPAGSTNIMSPSLSYTTATSASTDFNTLNRAYLQEQVFYGN